MTLILGIEWVAVIGFGMFFGNLLMMAFNGIVNRGAPRV